MISHRPRRRQADKLQPKFVGPYCVTEVMPNHEYEVEHSDQMSIQNEARLKSYWASPDTAGQTPPLLEPTRRLTIRERVRANRELEVVVQSSKEAANKPTDWLHHQWSRPTHLQSPIS